MAPARPPSTLGAALLSACVVVAPGCVSGAKEGESRRVLIDAGMTAQEVRERIGNPRRVFPVTPAPGTDDQTVEVWAYEYSTRAAPGVVVGLAIVGFALLAVVVAAGGEGRGRPRPAQGHGRERRRREARLPVLGRVRARRARPERHQPGEGQVTRALLGVLLLSSAGCFSARGGAEGYRERIQEGMDKEQVRDALGKPKQTIPIPGQGAAPNLPVEQWSYWWTYGTGKTLTIIFTFGIGALFVDFSPYGFDVGFGPDGRVVRISEIIPRKR